MIPLTTALVAVALLQIEQPDAGSTSPPPAPQPVRPAVPGEPVTDGTLDAGTLVIELRDAGDQPLTRAKVFVESSGEGEPDRRLEAETDGEGRIRVADLPTGDGETIVVGHAGASGVLVSTRPFALPSDGGARVLLVAPGRTSDPAAVTIRHLHVVLEREGDQLRVSETFGLATAAGEVFSNDAGLALPVAEGASGLRFKDAETAAKKARIDGNEIVFTAPVPPGGTEITVVFDVPIEDGAAAIGQDIPLGVGSAQVISTWTQGGVELAVDGFSEAEPVELRSGLTALVATAQGLPGGRLQLELEGIVDGPVAVRRTLTLLACVSILGFGLVVWLVGRARRSRKDGGES